MAEYIDNKTYEEFKHTSRARRSGELDRQPESPGAPTPSQVEEPVND